jgi:hypothetical protein
MTTDRIDISPKARQQLAILLEANRKSLENISLFIQNMALALDVDSSAFCFDLSTGAFVRMLPSVDIVDEDVLRLDEASEASHAEETPCGAV